MTPVRGGPVMEDAVVPRAGAGRVGETLGVEEEYHLVDPDTFALLNRPELSSRAVAEQAGKHLHAEMLTSQLEAATAVCVGLDDVRRELVAMRREAADAAAHHGAVLLATSTHPFAPLHGIEVMARPRYDRLVRRFGAVTQMNVGGCHVHVGVPDLETAVAIMTHARPYLPTLAALTGSSPFHEATDTGYASFRLACLDHWPQGGPPPVLRSAQQYVETVEQLIGVGLIDDASTLLWELRPSSRYPTLEFRVADICTELDDALLLAALVRSLVRTLGRRVAAGVAPREMSDAVLRGARWRAARFGLEEQLWSPRRSALLPARSVVDELLTELRPDLEQHDEYASVCDLISALMSRGTSSTRQRKVFAESGDLTVVARDAVARTMAAWT
jgi:YbdK family carboxylate-amine ligase